MTLKAALGGKYNESSFSLFTLNNREICPHGLRRKEGIYLKKAVLLLGEEIMVDLDAK